MLLVLLTVVLAMFDVDSALADAIRGHVDALAALVAAAVIVAVYARIWRLHGRLR